MASSSDRRDTVKFKVIYPTDGDPGFMVDAVEAHHSKVLKLCLDLEGIADSLPLGVNPVTCMSLANSLVPSLALAHEFEEKRVFPYVRKILTARSDIYEPIMIRLQSEHRQDEGFAQEVAEMLTDWAMCSDRCNAETTGYMLRGFFDGVRRHIWFEQIVLIDPIKDFLSRSGEIASQRQ